MTLINQDAAPEKPKPTHFENVDSVIARLERELSRQLAELGDGGDRDLGSVNYASLAGLVHAVHGLREERDHLRRHG